MLDLLLSSGVEGGVKELYLVRLIRQKQSRLLGSFLKYDPTSWPIGHSLNHYVMKEVLGGVVTWPPAVELAAHQSLTELMSDWSKRQSYG
jgi:hypothetical protein